MVTNGETRAPIDVLAVIVNYKSAKLTLNALGSLEKERARPEIDLKAVVVENASGDEELLKKEIGERFSSFATLVVSPNNGGFGAGNNLGLKSAFAAGHKPAYVYFLNPDTEIRPGAVVALVDFLEKHPRAGIAGSTFEHADGTPWPIAFRFPSPFGELEQTACTGIITKLLSRYTVPREMGNVPEKVDWISGASMMFRRATLEATGGFDETFFLYYEEIDLCLRAQRIGWECWYVPQSRVMHIRGQSTGVTVIDDKPKRLPKYWFESRRRYFAKNAGYAYAAAADVAFLLGTGVATLKRAIKREPSTPYLWQDFLRESVLLPKVRKEKRGLEPSRYYKELPGVG